MSVAGRGPHTLGVQDPCGLSLGMGVGGDDVQARVYSCRADVWGERGGDPFPARNFRMILSSSRCLLLCLWVWV